MRCRSSSPKASVRRIDESVSRNKKRGEILRDQDRQLGVVERDTWGGSIPEAAGMLLTTGWMAVPREGSFHVDLQGKKTELEPPSETPRRRSRKTSSTQRARDRTEPRTIRTPLSMTCRRPWTVSGDRDAEEIPSPPGK